MGQDTLDALMRISVEEPESTSFPFTRAVKLWAEKKDRRYKVTVTGLGIPPLCYGYALDGEIPRLG